MLQEMRLPQFLGIGAQKAGTFWLHMMLRTHSELYLPPQKEIHFFDQHYLEGLGWYSNNFMFSGNKVRGEITPAYAILEKNVIEFIHSLLPELKTIYLLRNPIERAWSHAQMEYIYVQKKKYDEIPDEEFISHFKGEGSVMRGDYETCIKNWLSFYDKTQMFIGFYDDIKLQPKGLLQNIFTFLNVSSEKFNYDSELLNKIVLKGPGNPLPERYKAILNEIYYPKLLSLKTYLPEYDVYFNNWLE